MPIRPLSKGEASLILYLECRVVDHNGRVNALNMNSDDFDIVERWKSERLIGFGRIVIQDHNRDGGNWVTFTDAAWEMAHAERKARGIRCHERRNYRTTDESSSHVPFVHPTSSLTSGCQ